MPTNFDGTGRFRPDPSLTAPWEDVTESQAAKETDEEYVAILVSELKTQMQQAWQRLDYKTADRIADLLGEPRPTEHEAKDKKHGG